MIKLNNSYKIRIILIFAAISKSFFFNQNENNNKPIQESKYLSIPFKENNPYYYKAPSNYSSYNFLYDYFLNNLSIDINIGTPTQTINSILNQESSCFKFIDKTKIKNNIIKSNKKNNIINKYIPKKSLTFLLNKNNKAIIAKDFFLFKSEDYKNYSSGINIPFIIDTDFDEINDELELVNEIGLNSKLTIDNKDSPNFLKELKKNKLIKEEIYSFIYNKKSQGYLIIGDNLFNIFEDKYKKINFFKNKVIQNINGIKWNINFDKIYIYDKYMDGNTTLSNKSNGGKVYLPSEPVNLKIDQNIIIGTLEYKNMIDNLYFNKLINSNICKIDKIQYNFNYYYVYSCTALLFATFDSVYDDDDYYQEPIYHYLHFPSLIFYSESLKYTFEIKYEDLFQIIGDRFYFMIVFNADSTDISSQGWVIGSHFLQKNIFSFNIKNKKIEFYNEKEINENFEDDDEIIEQIITKKETNKNLMILLIIVGGILFSIFSFYLGIKIKERRKKRAYELRDEYEYFSERETKNKSINSINLEKYYNSKNAQNKQEVELNIQF